MTIAALPDPPSRTDPTNFASRADAFLEALPTFATEANELAAAVNSNAATASTKAMEAAASAGTASAKATEASGSATTANAKAGEANASAVSAAASVGTASSAAATAVAARDAAIAASGVFASGEVTLNGIDGVTITHNRGSTSYLVKVSPIGSAPGDAGEISVVKASNTCTIYNTGRPRLVADYEISARA